MWFPTLSALRRPRSEHRPARGKPVRPRLSVDVLEDRTVPANFTAGSVPELIADIDAANLTVEADTITLVAGTTFSLTAVNNTTHGPTGLPMIANNLTIIGNADTIERSTATGTPAFRLFDVAAGASLSLENLTVQNGNASSSGGAIFNTGTLSLVSVSVLNNTVRAGSYAAGGALYSNGRLTIEGCTIQNNGAWAGPGENAPRGGYFSSPAGNGYSAFGGGVYVGGGTVTISSSTLSSNAVYGGSGGRGYGDNPSGDGGTAVGGGLYVASGTAIVHTTSITKNVAQGGIGAYFGTAGGSAFGGGVFVGGGTVALHNSSVTANVAKGGRGDTGRGQGVGGGIYIAPAAWVGLDAFTVDHVKRNKASSSDPNIAGSYVVIL